MSGDAIRLRQVIVNLVGNAIKFTERGEVSVDIDCEPGRDSQVGLHIGVRDTGIGIAEEKREQIFSAFEQADTSTTREFGGTGLGLAITSSIARAMEGRVWVESVPGEGSTFHFIGSFFRATEPHEVAEFPDLSSLPVLVVDDNETNRHILKEMLEGWGMPVETAAGGPQAIDLLKTSVQKQQSLPLVISDVHMPGVDGFMLTKQLRSTEMLNDTIVIMLTSGAREGDVQRRKQLGVSGFLMKPVKQSELLAAVVAAVGGQSAGTRSQPEVSEQPVSLPPLKILLAEDGEANQIVAVELLTKWGHTVAVAQNGEEAITLWKSGLFDVVLMDVQMPVLDGFAATRRIRELESESGQRIPIIAMTARAMKGDRERCLAAGMDDYVSKPFCKPELYRAIKEQTDGQHQDYCPTEQDADQTDRQESDDSSATDVIDWTSALKNVDGDRDLLNELMPISLQESKQLIEQLNEATTVEDARTAERLAHTIKGSAQTIGATETRNAAAAIEASAAQGDFNTLRQQMPRLREAVDELERAITQDTQDGTT
ncbi:MAG: response regulator [Fuerstiella sp.]|nr:response regulator [Fuerstiella sp.]MCP4858682.1 response regulator [Fuerstiella sp.]